jgi:hypothetical protein
MKQQRSELVSERDAREGQVDAGGMLMLVTLTVLLVLRKQVGYGLLRFRGVFFVVLAMISLNWLDHVGFIMRLLGGEPGEEDLRDYGFVFLLLAGWLRFKRKREKLSFDRPHSYSLGVSRLEFLPFSNRVIYGWVEPGCVFLAGALLHYRLRFEILGVWVMLAAFALFRAEWLVYRQTENHEWQLGDGLIEARSDADLLRYSGGQGETPGGARESYVSTGGDGLDDLIKQRKREMAEAERREGGERR